MEFPQKDKMQISYFNLEMEELYPVEDTKKLAFDNWLICKIYFYSGRHSFLKDRIRNKPIHSSESMSENDIDETVIQPTIDIDPKKMSEMDEHTRKEQFRKMRDADHNENPLAVFIRNDDVWALKQYLSRTNLPLGTCLPQSIFERCDFLNEPTTELIEYAAFFGSISVFKLLILNTSEDDSYLREMLNQILAGEPIEDFAEIQSRLSVAITRSLYLLTYAVAGGNYDIIHLCEEKKSLQLMIDNQSGLVSAYSQNETLNHLASQLNFRYNAIFNTAIRFHRNEIYDYLADSYYNNFLNDVLEQNLGNMLIENYIQVSLFITWIYSLGCYPL